MDPQIKDRVKAVEETVWVKKGATGVVIDEEAISCFVKWDEASMLNRQCDDQSWWTTKTNLSIVKPSFIRRVVNFFKRK